MPLDPTWEDIGVRLVLTLAAGALIGFNREAHGHAAGLRTTMLVCLAASVAMILANLLLTLSGKTAESFVRVDVMRLPLGILTGVGFIGGGVILRRNDLVTGVTTAATLWLVTVIGLCFGGGAIGLGTVATLISFAILWALKLVDDRLPRDQWATLTLATAGDAPAAEDVRGAVASHGCKVRLRAQSREGGRTVSTFDVRWRGRQTADPPMEVLTLLEAKFQATSVEWEAEVTD
jgi:putative Mg2+ transporter-C (MgtC) family protein